MQSAVLFNLMIIGEASAKLSHELESKYPAVDWQAITGFRNIIVHAYFKLSLTIVWDSITLGIPELHDSIVEILENEFRSPDDAENAK